MFECACINIDVDEVESGSRVTKGKSETLFICGECDETFPPGTQRERLVFLDDEGKEDIEKEPHETCADCLSVIKVFFCHDYYLTRIWEDVKDHIQELDGQISSECLLSLTPRARDTMFDLIQACWDDLNEDDDEDDE